MKLRAKANGAVLNLPDAEAEAYLGTGLYERIDEPIEPTKVAPMTTADMPTQKKAKK